MDRLQQEHWHKEALALQYTKEGLEEFVQTEIEVMHSRIVSKLPKPAVPQGIECNNCTTQNILKCSPSGTCSKRCRLHVASDPEKMYRPCPNSICNHLMAAIICRHRYVPAWDNTDARQWCTTPWEMAKCFLPHGSSSSSSVRDIDLSGLLNIIINNIEFRNKLSGDIDTSINVFYQARTIRNKIFHSGTFHVSTEELSSDIEVLITLLSDPKYLIQHQPAIQAVIKLKQLKEEPLLIGEKEAERMRQAATLQFEEDKRCFQLYLANLYLGQNVKIPLSFTCPDLQADVDDVYVSQAMKQVHLSHETSHEGLQQQLPDVKSYMDIFRRHSQRCNNIYIKGEAGTGKTSLCQRMVLAWCKFVKGEAIGEDESYIKNFSFLFYIQMRYVCAEKDLESMIYSRLLNLHGGNTMLVQKILDEESEKCLIFLDGLDEWLCTEDSTSLYISKGLPHRNIARRCSIVTTTRPWKLEVIRMKPAEMDQLIELTGLDEKSSETYVIALVNCLNKKFGRGLVARDFLCVLKSNDLHQFVTLPVVLRELVCLWYDGRPFGRSQCEIYSGMLDMLLKTPEAKTGVYNEEHESAKQRLPSDKGLPACFEGKENCQEFGTLLKSLATLSFHTLFDENQESALVFERSSVKMHGMSQNEIDTCLKMGILSHDIVMERCTVQQKNLSFLHKSFQEFLAALYVYLQPHKERENYDIICRYCCTVERVMETSRVFVFMSGMSPEMVTKVHGHIAEIMSNDERVQMYRKAAQFEPYPRKSVYNPLIGKVQELISECTRESSDNGYGGVTFYIEDLVIMYDDMEQLVQNNDGHIKSICINVSQQKVSLLQRVTQTDVLQKLAVRGPPSVPLSDVSSIISQSKHSLMCLDLIGCVFTDMQVESLQDMLQSLSCIEAIRLYNIEMTRDQRACLLTYLSQQTGLGQIDLGWIRCSDLGRDRGPLDLSAHTRLHTLRLQHLSIGQVIITPSNLKTCRLNYTRTRGIMSSILNQLQGCTQLETLVVWPIDAEKCDVTDTLIEILPDLHHQIKTIKLWNLEITERLINLSPLMKRLERVELRNLAMSSESVVCLVDSLPVTEHSLKVTMCGITITPNLDRDKAVDHITRNPRFVVTKDDRGKTIFLQFQTTVADITE